MSYQVLARKWRPRNFAEMVGQEHVLRALINALDADRLHHAFLFTGTRGVGKTTVARILAKSLNCERGVGSEPCGECGSCNEIDEGRFVDLIEVDAASRTGVDDTRDLLDNVQYAPSRGRYKVYLIDEVHMLSKSAFNALLKTLEEPPPHIKFLLATTDPQKIPVTVLSRCLQFNLKRLSISLIEGRVRHVLDAEETPYEDPALTLLSRAADGSMRDALSLLDQAIAFGAGRVEEAQVRSMLGTIHGETVIDLLGALADGEPRTVMDMVASLDERVPDYSSLLDELASQLQRIALAQVVAEPEEDDRGDHEAIIDLATRLSPEDVQLLYQIALIGRRDLFLAPDPRGGFEMVLLRMLAFRPVEVPPRNTDSSNRPGRPVPAIGGGEQDPKTAPAPAVEAQEVSDPPAVEPTVSREGPTAADPDWESLVRDLELSGIAGQLVANCEFIQRDGPRVRLRLDEGSAHLATDQARQRVEDALKARLGDEIRLGLDVGPIQTDTPARVAQRLDEARRDDAKASILNDPNVRALEERFDAKVQSASVRPHDQTEGAD